MHKMKDYIDDELIEMERKVSNGGRLSNSDLQRGDLLVHFKKSILTNEAMERGGNSYGDSSYRYSGVEYRNDANRLHSRGDSYDDEPYSGKRDSMGRYSREERKEMANRLYEAMDRTPDYHSREAIRDVAKRLDRE